VSTFRYASAVIATARDRVGEFERRLAREVAADLLQRAGYTQGPEAANWHDVQGWQEATRRFQAQLLERTLDECGWSVTQAARRLGIARSHVYALIDSFKLQEK